MRRSQKLLEVGAGAKNFRWVELEPEPEIWVSAHSPAFTYCWWHKISCSKRVIVHGYRRRPKFIAFRLLFVTDGNFFQEGWKTLENFPQYPKQWEVHMSRNLKWCNWSYSITCPKKHISETPLTRYRLIHTELRHNSWHIWRWAVKSVVVRFVDREPEVKVSRNGPERRSGKRIVAGTAFRLEFQVH